MKAGESFPNGGFGWCNLSILRLGVIEWIDAKLNAMTFVSFNSDMEVGTSESPVGQ